MKEYKAIHSNSLPEWDRAEVLTDFCSPWTEDGVPPMTFRALWNETAFMFRFEVVDTLSISAPQALLVLGAHALYEQGKKMDEVIKWVMDNRLNAQAWFTVGDLTYLRRGGRISATSAVMGTMLDIKPILAISKIGKLEAYSKVQGRKKAMRTLVDKTVECIGDSAGKSVIILQGDVREEAETLKNQLRTRLPDLGDIRIQMIGPVIGAHAGPGTLAICFIGNQRPM